MLNKLRLLIYVLFTSAILAACTGEDGEPGPQGDKGDQGDQGSKGDQGVAGNSSIQKIGYFEGTVSGSRKDGTAFSEAFKYQYTYDSVQAYFEEGGVKKLNLLRYLDRTGDAYLQLFLKADQEGVLTPQSTTYTGYFRFFKELDSDNLFAINARPYFEATEAFVREISYTQNFTYNFSNNFQGKIYSYHTNYYGNGSAVDAYRVYAYKNNKSYEAYYNASTGDFLGLHDNNLDQYITSGTLFDLYNKLKFKEDATLGMRLFFDATTGTGLYEEIPDVPADQLTITNYVHNATTGIITFDFEIKISGILSNIYYRANTTQHDLSIKGKFNSGGKVYKNTVGRTRG